MAADTSLADVRKRTSTTGVKPPPPNATKDGDSYDTCPTDGCIEVDRNMKIGGQTRRGENYLDAAFFHADRKQGGCGSNWVRTTKQGTARNHKRGIGAKWPTRGALTAQYISEPSAAYRSNFDCAFRRCGCAACTPLWDAAETARCSAACPGHGTLALTVEADSGTEEEARA